jgi:hypothetical protein
MKASIQVFFGRILGYEDWLNGESGPAGEVAMSGVVSVEYVD